MNTLNQVEELTAKELEILKDFCLGKDRAEVAAKFFIAPKTLRYYMHKIYMKLGVKKLHQAVVWYFITQNNK